MENTEQLGGEGRNHLKIAQRRGRDSSALE